MSAPFSGASPTSPTPVTGGTGGIGDTSIASGQLDSAVLTNVSPKDPPPMKTLVYSPDIQIFIARGNKQYDVSADIVSWSIRRVENSVSSVVFKLANKPNDTTKDLSSSNNLRYNQLFDRMDRVVVKLKRIEWIQVFSGYLDSVPHVQLYGGTVNFRASCTLKRLLHTWWDPGLPAAAEIFNQAAANDNNERTAGEKILDQGLGSMVRNILVKVGGWSNQSIHIQNLPMGYFEYMTRQVQDMEKGTSETVRKFKRLLLGDDISTGVGAAAGRQLDVTRGGYVVTQPERMLEVLKAVDEMSMGPDNRDFATAQALGISSTGGKDYRDQEAWKSQTEMSKNWADSALKNDAAVHCFMTIMVESNFVMYANNAVPESLNFPHEAVGTDHDSIGLYQQRPNWGSVAQRMNPRESTGMFLNQLKKLDWRNMDRGAACQAVQRSAFPARYAAMEKAAIEMVRGLRAGTGTVTGTGGQSSSTIPGLGFGGTGGGITGGAPGATALPQIPTSNGTPSVAAAGSALGAGPQYNTAGALSYARAQIGKPYVWGGKGPASFDCSGLTHAAYASIGMEIGGNTTSQAATMVRIPATNLVPGDLIQPNPGHVVMWTGNGTIIHAPQTGDVVKEVPPYFDVSKAACFHAAGAEYGGSPFAPFDPARAQSGAGATPGTVATGLGGGTAQVGSSEPIARNLFTWQFQPGQFTNDISSYYGSEPGREELAFVNDESLMQTVISFVKAGLRNFQSAPNGDFIAYYPDYFGLDGKGAVVNIEDIEMINVQIDFNDDAMATHVYVGGSAGPEAGANPLGWLQTQGIATVENEWLFRRLVGAAPKVPGDEITSGKQIMNRFGVRPLVQSMSGVQRGPMEFLLAMQIFMTKWAEQYATNIQTTFMPEVFPGMRLNLVGHNLQVYVSEVTHSGDYENGFTTQMTIMAPSNPSIKKLATELRDVSDKEKWDQRDINGGSSTVFN